jgi:hypothetical protein
LRRNGSAQTGFNSLNRHYQVVRESLVRYNRLEVKVESRKLKAEVVPRSSNPSSADNSVERLVAEWEKRTLCRLTYDQTAIAAANSPARSVVRKSRKQKVESGKLKWVWAGGGRKLKWYSVPRS